MVYYPTRRMMKELLALDSIPSEADRNYITSLYSIEVTKVSDYQYNRLLDLYNKYIVVPAGITQIKRNQHY